MGKNSVPMRHLIQVNFTEGPTEIQREQQVRQVILYGNVEGRGFSDVVNDIEERIASIGRPYDYQIGRAHV